VPPTPAVGQVGDLVAGLDHLLNRRRRVKRRDGQAVRGQRGLVRIGGEAAVRELLADRGVGDWLGELTGDGANTRDRGPGGGRLPSGCGLADLAGHRLHHLRVGLRDCRRGLRCGVMA